MAATLANAEAAPSQHVEDTLEQVGAEWMHEVYQVGDRVEGNWRARDTWFPGVVG